jgi:hypothetical protein
MLSSCAALLVLAGMGWTGTELLRKFDVGLTSLELFAYGVPLGVVLSSLAILILAGPFGLSAALVGTVTAASVAATVVRRSRPSLSSLRTPLTREFWSARTRALPLFAVVVFAALILRWIVLFRSTLTLDSVGLWAGHRNIWGDWAQHLGDVTSFAYGDNFPPTHPRLAGLPFAYHYLTSVTVAAMVALGMSPIAALLLHSLVFTILLTLGVYAFAKRLTGGSGPAALAVVLFLLGGGLGWTLTLRAMLQSHGAWETLMRQPWDAVLQQKENFRWLNTFFSLIYPQRSFLYGLPIGLLVLTLLLSAAARRRRREFLIAGVVAGLLPFAHLGTLLSLALITPFLFLFFPSRGWIAFYAAWVAVAVPQLWIQQGGGPGAAGAIRFHPGWVEGTDAWWWFWLKNLGAFIPLLGIALFDRQLLSRPASRMLWAFMPVFVAGNLVAFQPWDWDNSKVLAYWFLAACILVAAVLAKMWREYPAVPVRLFLIAAVMTMTLSGMLENLEQLLGRDRHLLLTREEVGLAETVRRETDPHAIFAAGLQHNHPISVLSGRRVLMSFPGWMWSQGADTKQREHDLRAILTLSPQAKELMDTYRVDYVVIGPNEKEKMGADLEGYRRAFPTIARTDSYDVFDVRAAAGATSSSKSTSGSRTPRD